jgi:lipopolysaccharide assembly outer membrane protein LptD (OstA)
VNFSLKAKERFFNSASVRYFIVILFIFIGIQTALAQGVPPESRVIQPEGLISGDSIISIDPLLDTIPTALDTIPNKNVAIKPPKGDIETTINYTARDSIRASLDNQIVYLYGEARIVYGEIQLEADEIEIDYGKNTLTAHGTRDSLGRRVGYPVFKNGGEVYETKDIVYNFKTKRARISEVVTTQGEGILHADAAFKNEKNEILSVRNSYTTCNLEHPHFRIRSTKTKAIPDDKIVSGPFYMEFNDIPLPIGFLFGMFPSQRKSSSGIIFPSYGEEKRRGFNLRRGGYFFDINDYIKLGITGDIYSKGGHALNATSSYIKRYRYSGNFNFSYSKTPDLDDKIETTGNSKDFRLTWSHSPQTKGPGRFSASVNAATASFTRNNLLGTGAPNEMYNAALSNISTKLSSSVSYSHRFVGTPFNMAVNMRHNQDLRTKVVDLDLPTISLNMTNIYPLQRKGKTGPFDNLSLSYTMAASNRVTNNLGRISPTSTTDSIAPFTGSNFTTFFENGRKGMRHSLPVSFSFKALKYLTVSPSLRVGL